MNTSAYIRDEEYPQNLLDEIARQTDGPDATWDEPLPPDVNQTLAYLLAGLTKRERKIIEMRFDERLTYMQIARKFDITQQRVKQIEAKAIRKLRNPMRRILLIKGVREWVNDAREAGRKEAMCEEFRQIVDEVLEIANATNKHTGEPIRIGLEKKEPSKRISVPLDEADLPVRAYNCLKRAGYTDLAEISKITWDELSRVRNMGLKSARDVVTALKTHGMSLAGDYDGRYDAVDAYGRRIRTDMQANDEEEDEDE